MKTLFYLLKRYKTTAVICIVCYKSVILYDVITCLSEREFIVFNIFRNHTFRINLFYYRQIIVIQKPFGCRFINIISECFPISTFYIRQ